MTPSAAERCLATARGYVAVKETGETNAPMATNVVRGSASKEIVSTRSRLLANLANGMRSVSVFDAPMAHVYLAKKSIGSTRRYAMKWVAARRALISDLAMSLVRVIPMIWIQVNPIVQLAICTTGGAG